MSFFDNLRNAVKSVRSATPSNRPAVPEQRILITPDPSLELHDTYEDTVNRRGEFESMLDEFSSTSDHVDRLNLLRDARDKFGNNAVFGGYIDRLGRQEEAYYDQELYINDVPNIGGYVKDALDKELHLSRWSPRNT